jgi:hypothetical protein
VATTPPPPPPHLVVPTSTPLRRHIVHNSSSADIILVPKVSATSAVNQTLGSHITGKDLCSPTSPWLLDPLCATTPSHLLASRRQEPLRVMPTKGGRKIPQGTCTCPQGVLSQ